MVASAALIPAWARAISCALASSTAPIEVFVLGAVCAGVVVTPDAVVVSV